jgi:arylsulfatase
LGCSGYENARTPNIDALARDGVVFRECIAQGTYTRISVPTIITGLFPLFTGIRSQRGHLDSTHTTVAEVLSADGYATLATNRMWSESFYQGFDETGGSDEPTPQRTRRAVRGLRDLGGGKFFIWLYYWDPHAPYEPPETFMKMFEPDYVVESPEKRAQRFQAGDLRDATGHYGGSIAILGKLGSGEVRFSSIDRRHLINLYDAEIASVDAGIGELLAELKKKGLYDRTLIILNADHGEGFGEHGAWYHGTTVYDEMSRVPLIIKPPGRRPNQKVVWGPVRNIDIMPTILDYCGLEVPNECNGQSLRPFIEGQAVPDLPGITETTLGRRAHFIALRDQGHKAIYELDHDKVWLYDLGSDPDERTSLLPDSTLAQMMPDHPSSEAGQLELELRAALLRLLKSERLADLDLSLEDLRPMDAEMRNRLKALGYVY